MPLLDVKICECEEEVMEEHEIYVSHTVLRTRLGLGLARSGKVDLGD